MDQTKLWQQYNAFRKRYAAKYAPAIYRALQGQIKYYIQTNDLNNLPQVPMQQALADLYKDVGRNYAFQTYLNVMREAGLKKVPESKRRAPIGYNQEFIDDIVEFFRLYILNLTTNITQTTRNQIRDIVSEGVQQQLSLDEIINNITTSGITKTRAAMISRTETMRAANYAEQLGANKTGLQTRKVWISVRDFRTRKHHVEVDNQVRPDGKPFDVDGYLMQRPGDQNSEDGRRVPGSLIVNCRCVVGREVLTDKNGLPLRKVG